jgi:hypothetical protein
MTELKSGELISAKHLMSTLEGQTFTSYRQLQKATLEHFNEHTGDIPPGYNYQHLIDWSEEHGWIKRPEFGQFQVEIPTPKAEVITQSNRKENEMAGREPEPRTNQEQPKPVVHKKGDSSDSKRLEDITKFDVRSGQIGSIRSNKLRGLD